MFSTTETSRKKSKGIIVHLEYNLTIRKQKTKQKIGNSERQNLKAL